MIRLKHTLCFFEADGTGGGGAVGDPSPTLIPAAGNPAPTPTSPTAPFFGSDGNFVDGWADKLPDGFLPVEDLPAFKIHASKYKSPLDAIKSDFHKEKMLGRKAQSVVVPGEKSTPEEIAAFRTALGVPETPDGYKLKPELLPEGMTWNDESVKPFAAIAHKHNIPPAAMAEIVGQYVALEQAKADVMGDAFKAELDKGMQTLKDTWKNDTEKNVAFASRVAKSIGLDPTSPGLRDPNVVIALQRVGAMLSEDKLVSGDISATLQPGAVRANEIMTNPADPMFNDYAGKNGKDRQAAAAKLVADLLKNG
jgi:hypothetical protein